MANKAKRSGNSYKSYYNQYNHIKQRKARLERHLRKYPNDEVAKAALDKANKGDLPYRRQAPKGKLKMWSSHNKWLAHTYRLVGDNGNRALLTIDDKMLKHEKEKAKKEERDSAPNLDDIL